MDEKAEKVTIVERLAIATVLDEFQYNLRVNVHAIKNEKECCKSAFVNELFSDLGLWEESDTDLLSSEAKIEIAKLEQRALYDKLIKDCRYILNVIETLKKEILEHGTFNTLSNEIKSMVKEAEEEQNLFVKCDEKKKILLELHRIIDKEKTENEETRKRLLVECDETRNKRIMSEQLSKIQQKYAIAWTMSQKEQEELQFRAEVDDLQSRLNNCKINSECDEKYTREITNFLTQHITHIEEECLKWEERTEKEKQSYEIQIHTVKSEIRSRQQILAQMRKQYVERQEFIDNYLAEKEIIRLEENRQALILQSTIKIQSWWRGVMVRRKLGPYKLDEKRKKKQGRTKK